MEGKSAEGEKDPGTGLGKTYRLAAGHAEPDIGQVGRAGGEPTWVPTCISTIPAGPIRRLTAKPPMRFTTPDWRKARQPHEDALASILAKGAAARPVREPAFRPVGLGGGLDDYAEVGNFTISAPAFNLSR